MTQLAPPVLGERVVVRGLDVFPVRHHSPIAARLLAERIRTRPPRVILIEGPSDADAFLPVLADPANRPPIALLSFRKGQDQVFFLSPYAEFSPEYQALRLGHELKIRTHFCDVPLAYRTAEGKTEAEPPPPPSPDDPLKNIDMMNIWEVEFEARRLAYDEYVRAAITFGSVPRVTDVETRLREAYMMTRAASIVAEGVAPEDILIVCGAAHAAPLIQGDVDLERLDGLHTEKEVAAFVVPYSYSRLSAPLGYGAGLPYPGFTHAIWEAGGDVEAAVCRMLTQVSGHLAREGYQPSLADSIDGLALAKNLAALRQRSAPGVPELVQAVESCLTRGRYQRAAEVVRRFLIGDRVGRLTGGEASPLAREFYDFVEAHRPLALPDRPLAITLDLHTEAHEKVATFLHRVRLAQIPYAAPGGLSAGWQEAWKIHWSPSVDFRLSLACVEGITIEGVARTRAELELGLVKTVAGAAAVFVDVVQARLGSLHGPARRAVEICCLASEDVPDLCAATLRLHGLVRYEGVHPALAAPMKELFRSLVWRSLAVIASLGALSDEDAGHVVTGLSQLVDLRPAIDPRDRTLMDGELLALMPRRDVHPLVAGAATGLALLSGLVTTDAVAAEVAGRLRGTGTEDTATQFLGGLFQFQRRELIATVDLVRSLRDFVERLPEEEFVRLLPALRRTFGQLSAGERTVFHSNLIDARAERATRAAKRRPARAGFRADRVMTRALDRLTRRLTGGLG